VHRLVIHARAYGEDGCAVRRSGADWRQDPLRPLLRRTRRPRDSGDLKLCELVDAPFVVSAFVPLDFVCSHVPWYSGWVALLQEGPRLVLAVGQEVLDKSWVAV
jgi:hypothetical protein